MSQTASTKCVFFFPLPWWPGCFEHAVLMAVTALFSTVASPQPLTAYCMRCYDQKAQLHPWVPYGAQEHAHNPALATSQTITKKVSNRGSKKSPSNNRLENWLHFLVRKVYLGGYIDFYVFYFLIVAAWVVETNNKPKWLFWVQRTRRLEVPVNLSHSY